MKHCCLHAPYKSNMCKSCWTAHREAQYHCTWPGCLRPVFVLTLCRSHYRHINVECAWPQCHRPSYCKQVCTHHYRKREFPPKIECDHCKRPMYMDGKCFYHFTCRTCIECSNPVFSKQLCQRHYMRAYRKRQRLDVNGPTTNSETSPDIANIEPATTNQSPDTQSSLEHSTILH